MSTTQGPSTGPAGNSTSTSNATATRQPKKKSSILSFLSCCMAPDDANPVDGGSAVPANKISKVPSGRPTTASRPDQATINQQNSAMTQPQSEKEALQKEDPGSKLNGNDGMDSKGAQNSLPAVPAPPATNGDLNRPGNTRDHSLPDLPREAESSKASEGASAIPTKSEATGSPIPADSSRDQKDPEGDVKMGDSEPIPPQKDEAPIPVRKDESDKQVLPPPPPVPQQPGPSDESAPDSTEQKQQWLLPPIAPRFQGKKCLVLDLDETLVHSSFKVCLLVNTEGFTC